MIHPDGSTGLPAFDTDSSLAPTPFCGWSSPPVRASPGWQTPVNTSTGWRVHPGIPGSRAVHSAKCPEPNERGRLVGMIGRKQVASYPLQVARASGVVNLLIKVIGDVGAKSHVNPARRIDGEGARHIPSPRLVIPVPDDDQRSLRWS